MKEMWPECGESRPVTREGAEEYGILPEGGESTKGKAEVNAPTSHSLRYMWEKCPCSPHSLTSR